MRLPFWSFLCNFTYPSKTSKTALFAGKLNLPRLFLSFFDAPSYFTVYFVYLAQIWDVFFYTLKKFFIAANLFARSRVSISTSIFLFIPYLPFLTISVFNIHLVDFLRRFEQQPHGKIGKKSKKCKR